MKMSESVIAVCGKMYYNKNRGYGACGMQIPFLHPAHPVRIQRIGED